MLQRSFAANLHSNQRYNGRVRYISSGWLMSFYCYDSKIIFVHSYVEMLYERVCEYVHTNKQKLPFS